MTTETLLPASTRIGRLELRVNNLSRIAELYRDVVGLESIERDDDRAVLGAGGEPLLRLRSDPSAPERPESAAGLFHVAIRVPTREALANALGRIRERWRLEGASDHLVSEALYLSDPEGNGVEIYVDRPRAEWSVADDGTVEMDTLSLDVDSLADVGTGAGTVPAGTTLGHAHLEVSSLAAAERFYVGELGFGTKDQYGDSARFLAAGEYHHHVGLNVWNGRTDPASGRGLEWFELLVPADALDSVRERVVAADREPVDTDHGFSVADPDGIEIRVRPVA